VLLLLSSDESRDDPVFQDKVKVAMATQDRATRYKMYKELCVYILEQSPDILLPALYSYYLWQPWVKGYAGQDGLTPWHAVMYRYWWIDQDLKKSMAK